MLLTVAQDVLKISRIKQLNPYTLPPGQELDEMVHRRLFPKASDSPPAYSIDPAQSAKVRSKLKSLYGHPIITGQTRMGGPKKFFARYEPDPSTATEVLAESEPLALCRLAVLLLARHE
jgi:hypothetical protein